MTDRASMRGQLFSRTYLDRGAPTQDSPRFRSRFAAYIERLGFNESETAREIASELGVRVPRSSDARREVYRFEFFINNAQLRDVLDVITIIYNNIRDSSVNDNRKLYIEFINRAMKEENLSYRLDDAAGVHYFVDEEFERSRMATVSILVGDRYSAARDAFEDAHRAMLSQDTLGAVRRSFDAVENVFKQRFSVARLGATEVKSKLTPFMEARYNGRVLHATGRLAVSLSEWTNAAHQFRHAPGDADPSPPPLEMAILMMSQAAGFLRWLASPALSSTE